MRDRNSISEHEMDLIRICNEIHGRIRNLVKQLELCNDEEGKKELIDEIMVLNIRKYKALDDLNSWRAE